MSKPLTAWIEGIGFLAPGMPDWPTARAILRGETPLTAAPSVLPAPCIASTSKIPATKPVSPRP